MTESLHYQFTVDGCLSARAMSAFPELDAAIDAQHGTTALFGTMADRTAVRSVLARLDDLGFTLLEMRQIPGWTDRKR